MNNKLYNTHPPLVHLLNLLLPGHSRAHPPDLLPFATAGHSTKSSKHFEIYFTNLRVKLYLLLDPKRGFGWGCPGQQNSLVHAAVQDPIFISLLATSQLQWAE